VLSARLKLIGSCRNAGGSARVDALRQLAEHLQIQDYVDFHVNAPWDEVRRQWCCTRQFHIRRSPENAMSSGLAWM
jgi:hypothetical protein